MRAVKKIEKTDEIKGECFGTRLFRINKYIFVT